MRPIPVAFHIWFLEVHTYGIGLALTFWFGLRYTERRLRKAGYPWQWVTGMFVWVIIAAIVGARALHVVSMWSYYTHNPGQIIAIWQGGLSSFGGILFAVPVALVSARRRCPQLPLLRFADLMAPVLMACWGIGRLLGPQLMVAGGGRPTNAWYGMYYAGEVGKRVPVPIFQSIDDWVIFAVVVFLDRRWHHKGDVPNGAVLSIATALWGLSRFFEEKVWLAAPGQPGDLAVEAAGLALFVLGLAGAGFAWRRQLRRVKHPGNAAPQPLSR